MSKKQDRTNDFTAGQILARLERLARLIRSSSHTKGLIAAQWEALRYLSRANRFSNSPGALSRYLGATKGTTSQTVLSLIKKGTIAKSVRQDDGRSINLVLTEAGQQILNEDPLLNLDKQIAELSEKTTKRFRKGLDELLHSEVERLGEPSFGNCDGCTHADKKSDKIWCKILRVEIDSAEKQKLCIHHKAK